MTYQALARKWRPRTFQQLVGQTHVVQALVNGLEQNRLHHAFLFTGTRGVGKTTIARILAKCLNCEQGVTSSPCGECGSCTDIDEGRFIDMIEIDAASRTGVDDTRELLESVQYTPTRGRYKVYIIDEVHMLSTSSFNALLKTLEEPPPHVKFVLATTDPEKIPVTILSRCLQFNLKRMLPEQIRSNLAAIVDEEGMEAQSEALMSLARAADGSMRDGLSLLDQAIAYGAGKLSVDNIDSMLGTVDRGHVFGLLSALAEGDGGGLMTIVDALVSQSRDLDSALVNLAEALHRICLVQAIPDYRDEERGDWDRIVESAGVLPAEDAQLYYQLAIRGRADMALAPDPRTGLEMTLLRMLAFRPAGAIGQASPPAGRATGKIEKPGTSESARASSKLATKETGKPAARVVQAGTDPEAIDWVSLASGLSLKGPVRELARNLHLRARSDEQWEFAIAPSLRHLGSSNCVEHLSRALSDHTGHPVCIRLIDGNEPDLLTAASLEEQQMSSKMSEAGRALERDPTIRALKEQMGATVQEDSIQPVQ